MDSAKLPPKLTSPYGNISHKKHPSTPEDSSLQPSIADLADLDEFDMGDYADAKELGSQVESILEQENPKLGQHSINAAIDKFLEIFYPLILRDELGVISTKNFSVFPAIMGEEVASHFIEAHSIDGKFALVPYGVTERFVGEDHFVLLVVKGNKSTIIDPKFGLFLGDAVPFAAVKSLGWQGVLDTTNCGFYVYHLVTSVITALEKEPKTSLFDILKNMPEPKPEEIQERMRRLYNPAPIVTKHDRFQDMQIVENYPSKPSSQQV